MATRKVSHPSPIYIAEWRERIGLTQEQVAERLGIGRDQVSRMESGDRRVLAVQMGDIARALECEISDLFRKPPSHSGPRVVKIDVPEDIARDLIAYRDGLLRGRGK